MCNVYTIDILYSCCIMYRKYHIMQKNIHNLGKKSPLNYWKIHKICIVSNFN